MILGNVMSAAAQGKIKTTDSTFIHDSYPIIPFVVGKKDIQAQDRKWITTQMIPRLQALGDSGIILGRASTSPEGSLAINRRLARERMESMNALLSSYGIDASRIQYDVVPLDFALMRSLMRLNHDSKYPVVDSLMAKYAPNDLQLKEAMIRQDKGKLWQYLYHQYFPQLRSVRIMPINKSLVIMENEQHPQTERSEATEMVPQEELSTDSIKQEDRKEPEEENIPEEKVPEESPSITFEPRRELLSIKTNLLYDFAYMPGYERFCPIPNVAIEYYPLHGHFTYGASFEGPWWRNYNAHKYFQLRNYQLHTRYYLRSGDIRQRDLGKGAAFKGVYFSTYAHAYLYNICFGEKRGWEGEGWGAGLGIGYVLPLDKKEHWRLEFGLQAGFLLTDYDPYQWRCPVDPGTDIDRYYYKWYGDANDFKKRQYRYTWLGPTRLEITLSYDILYRNNYKRGASFRNRERINK